MAAMGEEGTERVLMVHFSMLPGDTSGLAGRIVRRRAFFDETKVTMPTLLILIVAGVRLVFFAVTVTQIVPLLHRAAGSPRPI